MLTLSHVPLAILNRALDLYGQPRQTTTAEAWDALASAEGRIDVSLRMRDMEALTPLALAVAEYLSLAGPWAEDGGEHAGRSGYQVNTL
jgi:hypothetical protein